MVFEYGALGAEHDDLRRMSILLGADGKMVGAKVRLPLEPSPLLSLTRPRLPQLLDSSEDISDIVQAYLPSQDIPSLVQEIRTRFGW